MLKLQAEMAVFVGLVVLSLVVIGFVGQIFFSRPQPSSISQLTDSLKQDIEKSIYSYSLDFITRLGENGGRMETKNSVAYGGYKTAYWQMCQNRNIPSLNELEQTIKNNVLDFADNLKKTDFQGKAVSIGPARDIDVSINAGSVQIKIYMPTRLEGLEIEQPYTVDVPVGLGRAHKFAEEFVEENSQRRFFETFVASLFYHMEDSALPTIGALTKCGESIYLPREQAMQTIDSLVAYAMDNMVFWEKPKDNSYLKYHIPSIKNSLYKDIKIRLIYPQKLSPKRFRTDPSTISVTNSKIAAVFVPLCAKGYNIKYSAGFPVVVQAKTPDGYIFNFGIFSYIDGNRAGSCKSVIDNPAKPELCSKGNLKCPFSIQVVDLQAQPVSNAVVTFGSCPVGRTDEAGKITGNGLCGISELSVYNPLYTHFYDVASSLDIVKTIVLKKAPNLTVNFNKMGVSASLSLSGQLSTQFSLLPPSSVTGEDPTSLVSATFRPKDASPWKQLEYLIINALDNNSLGNQITVNTLPADNYTVEVQTSKKMVYMTRICDKYLGPICTGHKEIRNNIVVIITVNSDFELKETDREIFITAFVPAAHTTTSVSGEMQYATTDGKVCTAGYIESEALGGSVFSANEQPGGRCVGPVSRSPPSGLGD